MSDGAPTVVLTSDLRPAVPDFKFENVPEDETAEFGRSPPGRSAPRPGAAADLPPHVRLPTQPPYKAYLKNLPFGVTDRDIANFFKDLTVCMHPLFASTSSPDLDESSTACKRFLPRDLNATAMLHE